jgi:hypothetical protein
MPDNRHDVQAGVARCHCTVLPGPIGKPVNFASGRLQEKPCEIDKKRSVQSLAQGGPVGAV